jgi:pimeloyl-ACP methyl ester carboxylesterase
MPFNLLRFGVAAVVAAALLGLPTVPSAKALDSEVTPTVEASATKWSACSERSVPKAARCAWVSVPRDWARPSSSGTYRIRVARIPATGKSLGVLTFNPGGPGGSGIQLAKGVYRLLPAEVRRSFDFVAWDPRGVGRSEPALRRCTWQPPAFPPTGRVDAAAVAQTWFDAVAEANQQCLRRNRDVADTLGTWQVVRDLDAIRKALGVRQISLWGMSYGTTIGRAYAQLYPNRLRALVLDGAIAPAPSIHSYMREHIWDDVTAVERMLAAFGGGYVKTYGRAMRYLDKRTLRFADGEELNRWDFGSALMGAAPRQRSWPEAIDLLDDVRAALNSAQARTAERASRIAAAVESLQEPDPLVPQPRQDVTDLDFLLPLVNCADMPDRPSAQALGRTGAQAMGVGGTPYLIPVLIEGSQCAGLPRLGRPLPGLHTVLRLSPRPVVVNAVADNATPYLGARELANAFASAPMVVYDGTQHVIYGRTSSCIDTPVTRYLLTLQLPPRSTACPLNWER